MASSAGADVTLRRLGDGAEQAPEHESGHERPRTRAIFFVC